jgi:hypothetical protein
LGFREGFKTQRGPICPSILVFLVVAAVPTMVVPLVIRRSVGRTIVVMAVVVPAVVIGPIVTVSRLILLIPGRAVATPIITRSYRHLEAKVLSA